MSHIQEIAARVSETAKPSSKDHDTFNKVKGLVDKAYADLAEAEKIARTIGDAGLKATALSLVNNA